MDVPLPDTLTFGKAPEANSNLLDTTKLMSQFDVTNNNLSSYAGQIDTLTSQNAAAVAAQQKGISDQAQAESLKTIVEGDAAANRQAHDKTVAADWGTNIDASSYVIGAMATNILSAEHEVQLRQKDLQGRQDEIQKKMDTGFLDSPGDWLMNQFTLPHEVAAYNTDEANTNQRIGFIKNQLETVKELMDRTQDGFKVNAIVDAADASRVAALTANSIKAIADQKVAEASQKLAQFGLQGVSQKAAITREQLSAVFQLNSAIAQQAEVRLNDMKLNFEQKKFESEEQLRKLQIGEAQANLDDRAAFQNKLNNTLRMINMKPITIGEYKLQSPEFKAGIEGLMNNPSLDEQRFGITPANSLNTVNSLKINVQLSPGQNMVRDQLTRAESAFIQSEGQLWGTYRPDQRIAMVDEYIQSVVGKELKNIPPTGGLYSPPPLSAVLTANPQYKDFKISKELSTIAEADPNYKLDPNQIIKASMKLIEAGQATPEQLAREISTLFTGAMVTNNDIHDYKKFALPNMTPTTTGFNMHTYLGSGWLQNTTINWANSTQVMNAILKSQLYSRQDFSVGQMQ